MSDVDAWEFVWCVGKLIICRVTGIAHRRPNKEQLEVANPVRNDETGLWQCPFCDKKDFPELSEVTALSYSVSYLLEKDWLKLHSCNYN